VYFPRVDDGVLPVAEAGQAAPAEQGRGEHILVVDDKLPLVHWPRRRCGPWAYQPAGFVDPHEALAAFAADPARFDLVITDEIMPGLAGTELAQRLRTLRADIPVLLLSGHGGPQLVQRTQAAGVGRVLVKPLVRGDLAGAVAVALRAG
jgi:CheY-like chemotaxis protein